MEIRRPDPTSDFDEVLALVQVCDRSVYGDSDWTAAELREEWDGLDVGTDAWVGGRGRAHCGRDARLRAAGLEVDAENTTHAVALYERVGMHVVRRSDTWERTA